MKKTLLVVGVMMAVAALADVPGEASPTWWGVINNYLLVRFQNDGGVTTTYRAYVKYSGEDSFTKLGDVACSGGTGGQIISITCDGTSEATFRVCRVNADGEGEMSSDLAFTQVNPMLGTLISSSPFDTATANLTANAADGNYTTCFNSKAEDETWIGVDFGEIRSVTGVRFIPRDNRRYRMTNAVVQVANESDFSDATTIYEHSASLSSIQTKLTTIMFGESGSGRYVRWLGQDADKFFSVAEIEFLNETVSSDSEIPSELTPADVSASSDALLSGGCPTIGWADASGGAYPVSIRRATAAGGPYTTVAGVAPGVTSWTDSTAALGVRYYYTLQYTNSISSGAVSQWTAYRRLRRLERTDDDNTKLKDGVTVLLSNTGNEGNASWKSANAFDGNTNTVVSCPKPDTRIALDFGDDKVGVALVRAHQAPNRVGRLQTAHVYATDGDYLTTGTEVSDGGLPYSETWVTLTCSDPKCYKVFYLMRPDHVNFYSCMAELEMYGWLPDDEASVLIAPTRLTKTVSSSSVALAWDVCNLAASYRVEKLVGGAWTVLGTTTSPAYTDSSVSLDGTSVSYRIVSIASGGTEEAISETFTFVPYVPADGTGLTAVYSKPYASTAWSASEDSVAVTNIGESIDFDWQRANPVPAWPVDGGIYTVRGRWYGKIVVPYAGSYTFKADTLASTVVAAAIDGVWAVNSAATTTDGLTGTLELTAGEHDFYAEFARRDAAGIPAKFVLKWSGAVVEEVIPSSQFIPAEPYGYGDWTSVRTFGDVPQVGMVFPSEDGASFRFNKGSLTYADNAGRYLAMSRAVKGDFDLTFHAALLSPSEPNGQRFGVKVASSLDLTAAGAFYFFGYSASDNGSGWTFSGLRTTEGSSYTWPNGTSWVRRGEFLRGGAGDVRVRRKGGVVTCYYKDPETAQWTVDYTLSTDFLPATAQVQLFTTAHNEQVADVIWEISNISIEPISGVVIIVR